LHRMVYIVKLRMVAGVNHHPLSADYDSYHTYGDAPYMLLNDEEEYERLQDIQYFIHAFLGKNVIVPISPVPDSIGTSC
jgi:hypothetical protein